MLDGRELKTNDYSDSVPSPEVLSVIQPRTINEPLSPNLETLDLWRVEERFIPFVPLFLSPRTTSIEPRFVPNVREDVVASMVKALQKLCPNSEAIKLYYCPGDPAITVAIFRMLLVTNRNCLQ